MLEPTKYYRESDIPAGGKKMYLCRFATANGPCRESEFSAPCIFPRCRFTAKEENARDARYRVFIKQGDTYYEEDRGGKR